MPIGSLSTLNSSLAFGFGRAIRLQTENRLGNRGLLCGCFGFSTVTGGNLFVKNHPDKLFISEPNHQLGTNRKNLGVRAANCGSNSLLLPTLGCPVLGRIRNPGRIRPMAASGSVVASGDLIVDNFVSGCGNVSGFSRSTTVHFASRSRKGFHRASMRMRNREPSKNQSLRGYFIFDVTRKASNISSVDGVLLRNFHTSSSASYSDGAVPDVPLNESSSGDDHLVTLAIAADRKICGSRSLKLLSGSCYLPHPDKEETGGEDAHFICVDEQVIGVADGVGGWADVGVNAGEYARALMANSVKAIQAEPKDCIDPARVLESAHSATKAQGSSTACIIALTDQGLRAINLGDSGFVVVRDGCTLFQSPVQQHGFNFTYQLERGNNGDLPSSGQVFNIPVEAGDVIVAGTDGLFDNLYNNDVTTIVVQGVRAKQKPEVIAQRIAALAQQKALDRKHQSPFSIAAQEAGYRYYGGKLDDITVVVSFVSNSTDID